MTPEQDSRFEQKLISVAVVACVVGTWFAFLTAVVRWVS